MSEMTKKFVTLSIVGLVIAIALLSIEAKIAERRERRNAVVEQIGREYAGAQQVVGPLLVIDFPDRMVVNQEKQLVAEPVPSRVVRPLMLTANGKLTVEQRYRGIYQARTFDAELELRSEFRMPDIVVSKIAGVRWVYGIADSRGIREMSVMANGDAAFELKPGKPVDGVPMINVQADIDPQKFVPGASVQVRTHLRLAGTGALAIAPIGETNRIDMASPWPHPRFVGEFLPASRRVAADGFIAQWMVNDLSTNGDAMLKRLCGDDRNRSCSVAAIQGDTFSDKPLAGVSLIDPVDQYAMSDRAVRYGFLFVLLTLGVVVLFEILKGVVVHPLQYLLAGLAVAVFFLLLFALSEHVAFRVAYLIAAAACSALLTYYAAFMLRRIARGLAFGVLIAALYGAMYVLLTLEDTAFLVGAIMQFTALAIAMVLTRQTDWFAMGGKRAPHDPGPSESAKIGE